MKMRSAGLVIAFLTFWMFGAITSAKSPATKPANWIVHITAPDGSPAAGALVVVILPNNEAILADNAADIRENLHPLKRIYADSTGTARIPKFGSSALLVTLNKDGYATANAASLAKSRKIQLQKWCIVQGTAMVGTKPAANRLISVEHIDPSNGTILERIDPIRGGTTDASGHFRIDHVMAGDTFAAIDEPLTPNSGNSISAERQYFHLQPGQTKTVKIGGEGRPVVGRFIPPAAMADRSTWKFYGPAMLTTPRTQPPLPMPDEVRADSKARQDAWYQKFINSDVGKAYLKSALEPPPHIQTYLLKITPDLTFRAEDIPAGQYDIEGCIVSTADTRPVPASIGRVSGKITVPPMRGGRSDIPLKLDIPITLSPDIGSIAPDFTVPGLDGGQIKLSNFRGKFVLLDIWATYCGPCLAETPNLEAVYKKFHPTGRLVIIGLDCDATAFPARRYIQTHGINWRQGFMGLNSAGSVANTYIVRGIPSIWLIGPDGKILAKELQGPAIERAVATAMDANSN